jgi:hypothetical protein
MANRRSPFWRSHGEHAETAAAALPVRRLSVTCRNPSAAVPQSQAVHSLQRRCVP